MNLTKYDLDAIRNIVREEATSIVVDKLAPIEFKIDHLTGRVIAVEEDVKEIYNILLRHGRSTIV